MNNMFDFLPASYYAPIFYNLVLVLTFLKCFQLSKPNYKLFELLVLFLIVFIGLRPISGRYFVDTANYAAYYRHIQNGGILVWDKEWIFNGLMLWFIKAGFSVHAFFLFVEAVYVGCSAWACRRLFKYDGYLVFLMVVGAFSFYSYSMNGIRNGMAAAIVLLALSFLNTNKWIVIVLSFIAVNVHYSILLPVLSMIVCLICTNSKFYITVWTSSIFISLLFGGSLETFFASSGLIEDERFANYLLATPQEDTFSSTGFRWDFLLYSCIPIVVGYYFVVIKRFRDRTYQMLLNTYILANSFWILVIRASFSNRFAYLSWFLYGIVLIYPFLICPNLLNREQKVRLVLIGNFAFTYFMWLIG